MPTPPFFDSDYRIHLISANGQVGRSLTTSDGARLAAGSASPSGNKLLIIDGRPNFYLSAISAAGLHTHLYNRLTQLTR